MESTRHFYNLTDLGPETVQGLLDAAARFKKTPSSSELEGRQLALLFFNPSLRTRCSFEVAIRQMGGGVSSIEPSMVYGLEMREGRRMDQDTAEHVRDAARVLSRYYSALGVRSLPGGLSAEEDLADATLHAFMKHATVPVFNMESSLYHPCQALADMLTVGELLGGWSRRRITLTWASHPRPLPTAVPNSLLLAAAGMGMEVTVAHPQGFELPEAVTREAARLAKSSGGGVRVVHDRREAVDGAEILYAKSWGALSRYSNPEGERRLRASHDDWMVDEAVMNRTDDAWFMHCLPVRRNVVVTDGVIDGPRSAVLQQAENRMHAQKAILEWLLAGAGG